MTPPIGTDAILTETAASERSAHTRSRKGAQTIRMDFDPARRTPPPLDDRAEADDRGTKRGPRGIADKHCAAARHRTGQFYTWWHALKAAQPIGRFARVEVAPQPVAPPDVPTRPPGLIEIALSDGTTVRVEAGVDPRALHRVLAAWRG